MNVTGNFCCAADCTVSGNKLAFVWSWTGDLSVQGILSRVMRMYNFGAVDAANVVEPRLYSRVGSGRISKDPKDMVAYLLSLMIYGGATPVILFCCRRLLVPHCEGQGPQTCHEKFQGGVHFHFLLTFHEYQIRPTTIGPQTTYNAFVRK